MLLSIKLLFCAALLAVSCETANILAFFQVPSPSHHIISSRLLKTLAKNGHQVTVVSPYPLKQPLQNYRDVFVEEILEYRKKHFDPLMQHNASSFAMVTTGLSIMTDLQRIVLENAQVQALKSEKFDLIIQIAINPEGLLGFAHHFQAPVILFNTLGSVPMINRYFGNPAPPSYIPSMQLQLPLEMSFLDRLKNTLYSIIYNLFISHYFDWQGQRVLTQYFPSAPPLAQLVEEHVALVFLNSHFSIESPRPHVPNMIQVGGLQIEDAKPLPEDIKQFLDGAGGAVLFSLGSNVRLDSLPEQTVSDIVAVLGSLKMRVLFKSDSGVLQNVPDNFKVAKWLPQNDILAHENVKVFVSHGGLLSTTEAVYHGVPIIGIPIFGDQKSNVAEAANNGYAVQLRVEDLNKESFTEAFRVVLDKDSKIRENIELRSSLLKNQPMKPIDTAVYWVEHVLKYKGAKHLKNHGAKLPLYMYFSLDVFAVLIAALASIIFVLVSVVKVLRKLLSGKNKTNKQD